MSQYTSYYLYQRYESIGNQPAVPSYPAIYSIDGDGTRQLVIRKENDEDCGYDSGGTTPQYRWVTDGTICIGYDKYSRQTKQVSYDSGVTWNNVYPTETQAGSLIEANSSDCGAATIYRWEVMDSSTDYICDGTSKYYKEQKYVSYNNGRTWQSLDEYRKGELIEYNSTDCGYVPDPDDYSSQYLTFESLVDDNYIIFDSSSNEYRYRRVISASTDNGQTWTEYRAGTSSNHTTIATLNAGQKVLVKGLNPSYSGGVGNYYNFFAGHSSYVVYGNIMSLVSGDTFAYANTLTESYNFYSLFLQNTHLESAENLVLPAAELAQGCYMRMFGGCSNLTTAPELPATMLAVNCYNGMFQYCTSLTTAPDLLAPVSEWGCYDYMFARCSSLNYIKCLLEYPTQLVTFSAWVDGVAQNGTFVKNGSVNFPIGNSGIPEGWTIQNV